MSFNNSSSSPLSVVASPLVNSCSGTPGSPQISANSPGQLQSHSVTPIVSPFLSSCSSSQLTPSPSFPSSAAMAAASVAATILPPTFGISVHGHLVAPSPQFSPHHKSRSLASENDISSKSKGEEFDEVILIADDEESQRKMLEKKLRFVEKQLSRNFKIIMTKNGEDALRVLGSKERITRAFLDFNMGALTGVDTLNHFRRLNCSMDEEEGFTDLELLNIRSQRPRQFYLYTAEAQSQEFLSKARESGFDRVLEKQTTPSSLSKLFVARA